METHNGNIGRDNGDNGAGPPIGPDNTSHWALATPPPAHRTHTHTNNNNHSQHGHNQADHAYLDTGDPLPLPLKASHQSFPQTFAKQKNVTSDSY